MSICVSKIYPSTPGAFFSLLSYSSQRYFQFFVPSTEETKSRVEGGEEEGRHVVFCNQRSHVKKLPNIPPPPNSKLLDLSWEYPFNNAVEALREHVTTVAQALYCPNKQGKNCVK